MTDNIEQKERSILAPLLIGGLVGAGIALLLAPKSGKNSKRHCQSVSAHPG